MEKNIYNLDRSDIPILSLQYMSVIKMITTLCNNLQLLNLILDSNINERGAFAKTSQEFKVIRTLAKELISKICNCTRYKDMLLELVWPVSCKIVWWKLKYAPSIKPTAIYWTDRGRIDNVTTVKSIIRNVNISIRERFTLACILCLGEEIHEIWKDMTDDDRNYFQSKNESFPPLLPFWIKRIKGYHVDNDLMYDVFEYAAESGLLHAIKYIFSILSDDGDGMTNDLAVFAEAMMTRKVNSTGFLKEDELDIGYLSYSKQWKSNKLITFHSNSALILSLILHSEEHEFFLKELGERLPFSTIADIEMLLSMLFYHYHFEIMNDHDYYQLFVDVWRMVCASVRNYLKGKSNFGMMFLKIMIKSEYRHLLEEESMNAIECATSSSEPYTSVTPHCFEEKDWEFLYFFIKEGIVTVPSLWKHRNVLLDFLEERSLLSLVQKSLNIFNEN